MVASWRPCTPHQPSPRSGSRSRRETCAVPRGCRRVGVRTQRVERAARAARVTRTARDGPQTSHVTSLGVGQDFSKFDPKFACARSARKSRKICLYRAAVITDSESHPASTHPPASPCSHSRRRLLSLAMRGAGGRCEMAAASGRGTRRTVSGRAEGAPRAYGARALRTKKRDWGQIKIYPKICLGGSKFA